MNLNILKKNELVKGSIWYTIANTFIKGVNFLTIPLFTRMLSTSQYGFVNNFVAWVSIGTIVIGLNLNVAVSNAQFDYSDEIDNFIGSLVFFSLCVFGGVILVLLMISEIVGISLEYIFLVAAQSFAMYVISIDSALYAIEGAYAKNSFLSLLSVLCNVGISLIFMVTLMSKAPAWGRVLGSTVGLFVLAVYIIVKHFYRMSEKPKLIYIKYAAKISIPAIPHSVGALVLSQFDRIMIQAMVSGAAAGIYSYAYNLATVINVLWLSVNTAWVPWFYRKMEEAKYVVISKAMKLSSYVFLLITMFAVLVLVFIARFMAPTSYQGGIRLIVPIGVSYFVMFMYSFFVNTEFYYKKTKWLGYSTAISAIVNVVLNLWLIPWLGYWIASVTTLISYILLLWTHSLTAHSILKQKHLKIYPHREFLFIYGCATLYTIMATWLVDNGWLMVLLTLLMSVLMVIQIRRNI